MVIPLLANQDLTPMLKPIRTLYLPTKTNPKGDKYNKNKYNKKTGKLPKNYCDIKALKRMGLQCGVKAEAFHLFPSIEQCGRYSVGMK